MQKRGRWMTDEEAAERWQRGVDRPARPDLGCKLMLVAASLAGLGVAVLAFAAFR